MKTNSITSKSVPKDAKPFNPHVTEGSDLIFDGVYDVNGTYFPVGRYTFAARWMNFEGQGQGAYGPVYICDAESGKIVNVCSPGSLRWIFAEAKHVD